MKKVFLVSGGLDSFLAYSLFSKKDDILVFVDYKQKYASKEYLACLKLYNDNENLKFIDIENYKANSIELNNNFIPNRNLFLASLITMFYYPDEIVFSALKDDNCIDMNELAFQKISNIISEYSNKEVKITSPFFDITKGQAIEMYINQGHDISKLLDTISCYSDIHERCGDCPACFRWFIALESCGIDTKLVLSEKIKSKYINTISNYEKDRQNRIKKVLNL